MVPRVPIVYLIFQAFFLLSPSAQRVPNGSRGSNVYLIFQSFFLLSPSVQRVPKVSKSRRFQEPSGPDGSRHPMWRVPGSHGTLSDPPLGEGEEISRLLMVGVHKHCTCFPTYQILIL